MKKLQAILFMLTSIVLLSCSKKIDCFQAKVLFKNCGGTVLQLEDSKAGVVWKNQVDNNYYDNCVLALNLSETLKIGDKIKVAFKETEYSNFNTCDIGGLPSKKVEITTQNCNR